MEKEKERRCEIKRGRDVSKRSKQKRGSRGRDKDRDRKEKDRPSCVGAKQLAASWIPLSV